MSDAPIIVIDMQEGLYWGDCPMCGQEKRLDHAVGWYEEAVHEDIGTILPHGGEVGGKCVCRECHDRHYAPGARPMTDTTTSPTAEELAARVGWPHESGMRLCGEKDIAAAIRQHSAPLEAQVAELTTELQSAHEALTDARIPIMDDDMRVLGVDERVRMLKGALSAMTAERDESRRECLSARLIGEVRAEKAEEELAAAQERERAYREALRKCISPFAGYAIQSDSQAVDVMKGFFAHIREVDGIARAAMQTKEDGNGR